MTYLTYKEIAELTGEPVNTLRVWLFRGKMPPPDYKPARNAAYWLPATIEAWREELRTDDVPAD